MPYKRGAVVLVLFPDSNLRTAKRRPALVVQADSLATGLAQTIVAMISSNMARAGHASRVAVLLHAGKSLIPIHASRQSMFAARALTVLYFRQMKPHPT